MCEEDKPIETYVAKNKGGKVFIRNYCRTCANHRYKTLKRREQEPGYAERVKAKHEAAEAKRQEIAAKMLKPVGWTPAPTQAEMAMWYHDLVMKSMKKGA